MVWQFHDDGLVGHHLVERRIRQLFYSAWSRCCTVYKRANNHDIYYVYVYFKVEPDWLVAEQFLTDDLQMVLLYDSLENSRPISMPVIDPAKIDNMFDRITYVKGTHDS